MHVKHLRYFASKISRLQHSNADLTNYLSDKVRTLCKMVLRDCCIELENSAEGVEKAASSSNHVHYLEMYRPSCMPKDVSRYCQQICSSSEESVTEIFPEIVPDLIQSVKEIFVFEKITQVQNGLRGLSEEIVNQFVSNARAAERDIKVWKLISDVCKILEQLCLKNCGAKPSTAEIEQWGNSLAILPLLDLLKPFFQSYRGDIRLHRRLVLFSGYIRNIFADQGAFADEVFMRDFANVTSSLIRFAEFDPSKLVRFELADSKNTPVNCNREIVKFDVHKDTFSQQFHIRRESEDELQLHAVACVHISGQVRRIGTFNSVISFSASGKEDFDKCVAGFRNVVAMKLEEKDADSLQVVLCSSQKEKLSQVLLLLEERLVDLKQSEIKQCHLTMRTVNGKGESVHHVSLRLIYEWGSEAVFLESNDFEACADSSTQSTCMPEVNFVGKINLPLYSLQRFA